MDALKAGLSTACLILVALPLQAQQPQPKPLCELQDTEKTCETKVQAAYSTDAKEVAKDSVTDLLAAKNTGSAPGTSPLAANSFTDFFSTLKAALDSGSSESDADDEAVGFELSRCARGEQPINGIQCQVRLRLGGAELYEPVKAALPAATREARAKELASELDLGDSLVVGLFFNLAGLSYGRVPRFADEPLYDGIWQTIDSEVSMDEANTATLEYEALRKQVKQKLPAFDGNTPFSKVFDVDQSVARAALAAREASWRTEYDTLARTQKLLEKYRYYDLVDLTNNQPQINFGVEYRQHSDLAGPDEVRAKVSYEHGFVNVNTARRYVMERCTLPADDSKRVVNCLGTYLSDAKVQKRLKGGDRVAASIEYVSRRDYSITLPADAVNLTEDSGRALIGALAYGFYTSFDERGEARSRLDVVASYEDVDSDPERQDRGQAVATFSQTLLGKTTLSISLVYATKPEFRGEVDEELSGRLGLNYKWGKLTEL